MCYTFDFLGPTFAARHFRDRIAAVEAIVGDGWPCWAFSNHDVVRHISRWAHATPLDVDRLARLAASILMSLRGSVCIYQGEELGFTEAVLLFEDLADPYGLRFWPEYHGRDGCRTPMVWEAEAPYGGFSTVKPWLPVAPAQVALAVNRQTGDAGSINSHYRRLIALRNAHAALRGGAIALVDAPDDVLAFVREGGGEQIVCLFNFAATEVAVDLPAGTTVASLGAGAGNDLDPDGRTVRLAPGGAFWGRAI
jgi:alpha-glucosidase